MATNNNAMEEFRAGVTACLRSWSAFRTAVESGWGGGERESQAKADELRRSIFDIMNGCHCPIPNFDQTDLADNLAIYLEEEFSVTLEDNSEQQVAETIFLMYETCAKGDLSYARQMVARAEGVVAFNSKFPLQLQTSEHDDDEDMLDFSQDVVAVERSQTANEYNSKPLFGEARKIVVGSGPVRQLGETEPVKEVEEVEADEDGFAPVKPKGKKRR